MRCRYDWCLHRIIPLDQLILRYYRLYAWSNVVFLNKSSIICKLNRDSFSHFFLAKPFKSHAQSCLLLITYLQNIFMLSCWHVTSNKSGNETPLRIKHKCWYTRNKEGDSYHMGILHSNSSCPLRMTDVNKKHLSDHARNPDTRLSRSWYLHSYPRLHAFPSITQWFLPVFFIMKKSHK